MSMKSDLGKVRGLGSAKAGTQHWWHQRVSAVANIFLGLWLVASLALGVAHSHASMIAWLSQPLSAVLLVLCILSIFYHIRLGVQVVLEDYLADHAARLTALIGLNFFCILAAALALFAILTIAFRA
jgi:succinate dehydrogenase / fumarate reductase, membrane anchor subunit